MFQEEPTIRISLARFISVFHTEEFCLNHLKKIRERQGLICKKCKYHKHYWLKAKKQWQCAACGFRTTLTSGTIMAGTRLSLRIWYIGMVCIEYSRKVVTVTELQRHLGHSRYESIWSMMCKVRSIDDYDKDYGLFTLIQYTTDQLEVFVE